MSESARIVDVLKRTLKSRGMTYRDLSKRVGLSEASVKRVFAEERFTLQRLEGICSAIGLTLGELIRMASNDDGSNSEYPVESYLPARSEGTSDIEVDFEGPSAALRIAF